MSKTNRITFAALLSRIFQNELDVFPHCGGKLKNVAALTDPASVRRYLEGTGQSPEIPEIAPARSPPQQEFDYEY